LNHSESLASASSLRRRALPVLTAIAVGLAFALLLSSLVPASASAAFSRPFLRQIDGPSSGPFEGPFSGRGDGFGGVALDADNHLWVGDNVTGQPPFQLDGFESAEEENTFIETVEIDGLTPPATGLTPPESVAIDRSNSNFYVTADSTAATPGHANGSPYVEVFDSSGAFVGRFGPVGHTAAAAVDNSGEPSAGTVYVAEAQTHTISKFNAAGEPVDFTESGKGKPYLTGNQITGFPGGGHAAFEFEEPKYVAVDSHGNIYTTVREYEFHEAAVLEYAPSGAFIRAFRGTQTDGLGESHEFGFGGQLGGVTTDPQSGDVLVSVTRSAEVNGTRTPIEGAVDEFDTSGRFVGQVTGTSSGHHLGSAAGIAVDSHGNLYVVDFAAAAVDAYQAAHFLPGLRPGEASQRTPTSAVLGGSVNPEAKVNPEHAGLTACQFEYVSEAEFEAEGFQGPGTTVVPCSPTAAEIAPPTTEDESWHPVHAQVSGLSSGTTYRYRLSATTGGEKGGTATTAAAAFTAPAVPLIEAVSAENLSSTFADLHAVIDPLGAETTYRFQYLTASAYAENGDSFEGVNAPIEAPPTPTSIGSGGETGSSSEAVLQHLANLAPATAYRFRVLAGNEIGSAEAAGAFATLPQVSPGLPDGRAYELVTPANKGSAEDIFGQTQTNGEFFNPLDVGLSSESGDQFLFEADTAFGPFPASPHNGYVFNRTAAGWSYSSLASPGLGFQTIGASSILFDPADFSRVSFTDAVGSAASEAGTRASLLLGAPGGPYTTLYTSSALHINGSELPEPETQPALAGASRDLSRLVLTATTRPESKTNPLCAGAEAQVEGSHVLCEYTGGTLKLLNAKSNGSLLSRCGAVLGAGNREGETHDAVSADGSRAFFTAPDPEAINLGLGCWDGGATNPPQLYMRSAGATTRISQAAENVSDPSGQHPATYVGAAEDGSRVFFLSEGELTGDDAGIHDPELYEYNTETGALTRVSHGESGHAAADVFNVPAVSADGSTVYFTAFSQLTPDAAPTGPGYIPLERTVDLYRYDTATGALAYVAQVGTLDNARGGTFCANLCPAANWYVTPNGRTLLFASSHELTGYGTAGPCASLPESNGTRNGHCDELYRYDSAANEGQGEVVCISCNPSGAPPVSNAQFARSAVRTRASGPVRALSADGAYAFFDTADPLVPEDSNGTLDVYEWHDGTISMLSSGKDLAPSFFLGASPDGANAFLGTHARLVPQDTDSQGDVYDARIGGGFPPPSGLGPCEGDACAPSPPAVNDQTPGTLSVHGPGNLVRCPWGKVRKGSRCVIRHHRTHHRRRHHKAKRGRAAAHRGGAGR
jgi:hypothetical protein